MQGSFYRSSASQLILTLSHYNWVYIIVSLISKWVYPINGPPPINPWQLISFTVALYNSNSEFLCLPPEGDIGCLHITSAMIVTMGFCLSPSLIMILSAGAVPFSSHDSYLIRLPTSKFSWKILHFSKFDFFFFFFFFPMNNQPAPGWPLLWPYFLLIIVLTSGLSDFNFPFFLSLVRKINFIFLYFFCKPKLKQYFLLLPLCDNISLFKITMYWFYSSKIHIAHCSLLYKNKRTPLAFLEKHSAFSIFYSFRIIKPFILDLSAYHPKLPKPTLNIFSLLNLVG